MVVEHRTGANGSLGAAHVAAATDGHTLLVSNTSTMTVNLNRSGFPGGSNP